MRQSILNRYRNVLLAVDSMVSEMYDYMKQFSGSDTIWTVIGMFVLFPVDMKILWWAKANLLAFCLRIGDHGEDMFEKHVYGHGGKWFFNSRINSVLMLHIPHLNWLEALNKTDHVHSWSWDPRTGHIRHSESEECLAVAPGRGTHVQMKNCAVGENLIEWEWLAMNKRPVPSNMIRSSTAELYSIGMLRLKSAQACLGVFQHDGTLGMSECNAGLDIESPVKSAYNSSAFEALWISSSATMAVRDESVHFRSLDNMLLLQIVNQDVVDALDTIGTTLHTDVMPTIVQSLEPHKNALWKRYTHGASFLQWPPPLRASKGMVPSTDDVFTSPREVAVQTYWGTVSFRIPGYQFCLKQKIGEAEKRYCMPGRQYNSQSMRTLISNHLQLNRCFKTSGTEDKVKCSMVMSDPALVLYIEDAMSM